MPSLNTSPSPSRKESGDIVSLSPNRLLERTLDKKITIMAIESDGEGKPMIKQSDRTAQENAQWASSSMLKSTNSNTQLSLGRSASSKFLSLSRVTSNSILK